MADALSNHLLNIDLMHANTTVLFQQNHGQTTELWVS
jgi:hypothetical protein